MQNKGVVKLFAILFGLVSIYQLSFTFKANQIEDAAKQFAVSKISETEPDYDVQRSATEVRYLDSLLTTQVETGDVNAQGQPIRENIKVFDILIADYSYNEVKDKAMNLGLDLKGGINVILQISVKDILIGLASDSKDPVFRKALSDAEELQKDSQNTYLEDFFVAFDAIKGDTKLASPDIFANRTLSDEITFNMEDDEVQPILRRKIDESIVSAFEVLRKRIDKFGVTQPNIQRLGNSGRILVELPGAKDVNRVKKLLQSTAQLEFWDAYKAEELGGFLGQANEVLKGLVETDTKETNEVQTDSTETSEDAITNLLGDGEEEETDLGPLFNLIRVPGSQGSPVVAMFESKDKDLVTRYLDSTPQVRALLPSEMRYAKFSWGIQAKESELVELYALKGNRDNKPPLSGAVITDARQSYGPTGKPTVTMQMNGKGAKVWEEMTGNAFNQGSQIAIVLDNIVYSAPGVTTGPISGGNSEISGQFTLNEAVDLANVLRAGKLPASADIVQADEVGPSLGQEAISTGQKSFMIALILVLIWMIFYYGKAGIFSDIALMLNILLIFGILSGLG
ncbi:MAG: protein translocase subunit SecDF, partial [Bacteroidia bacterium]|nr:protein translocase subunit SecDF [Bacteroidia bacterium]